MEIASVEVLQVGSEVSGAILKTSGDEGTLSGHWQGDKLVLSHFSGDRPMLFEATVNPDKTLSITLIRVMGKPLSSSGGESAARLQQSRPECLRALALKARANHSTSPLRVPTIMAGIAITIRMGVTVSISWRCIVKATSRWPYRRRARRPPSRRRCARLWRNDCPRTSLPWPPRCARSVTRSTRAARQRRTSTGERASNSCWPDTTST